MAEEININGRRDDLEVDPTVEPKGNGDDTEKINLLMDEIEGLKTNQAEMKKILEEKQKVVEEAEVDKRVLLEITARAAELETEVSRLQHELLENEEVSKELREKVAEVERIEKEKEELVERFGRVEEEKEELEKKVLGLESVRVSEEKAAKDEKEEVVVSLKEEVKKLEARVRELEMELKEKRFVNGSSERGVENVNEEEEGGGAKGLKIQWPGLVAASIGSAAVVATAAAMIYIAYARRR